jgi:secreted PhoX family phosphatase
VALSVDEGKERTSVVQHEAKRISQQRTREERIDQSDVVLSQKGTGETFQSLLQRRISRRGILKAGLAASAMVVVNPLTGKTIVGTEVASAQAIGGSIAYAPIPPQPDDAAQIIVTEGYSWAPLAKWGDPIRAGAPAYDPNNLSA